MKGRSCESRNPSIDSTKPQLNNFQQIDWFISAIQHGYRAINFRKEARARSRLPRGAAATAGIRRDRRRDFSPHPLEALDWSELDAARLGHFQPLAS
jgi:hypothetical protein